MIPRLVGRDNLLERSAETWRPPIFRATNSIASRCMATVRRFLDLQAASIWYDLQKLLTHCEGNFLDVGCGAQPYRELLSSKINYTGIDTVDAKDHFGYEVPDTIYFDGAKWPIDSNSISVVLATETLEHVPYPSQFLTEAKRCLMPKGYLVLTVPFAARWHYIPHDYWRFTPSGIRQILEEAGFDELVVYARGNELTVGCYKAMAPILALLFGQFSSMLFKIVLGMIGCTLIPFLVVLASIGQLSLWSRGGNDCLGYTIIARRPMDTYSSRSA